MRKKLIFSAFTMILIILMIVSGNQIIIRLFANFSQKLITEYHELHSLQELKVSLSKTKTFLQISDNTGTAEFHPDFEPALHESFEKMKICTAVLTDIHKGGAWDETLYIFKDLYTYGDHWETGKSSSKVLADSIYLSINRVISNIDLMVTETLEEIDEYEKRNDTVVKHGSATILVFGIVLIIFLTIGGLRFIKTLTRPIDQLVDGMKKISQGNTSLRVKVDSDDEFLFLADSLNSMLEVLNSTSVSKEFFSKILNNLFGALVVTDNNGKITFINDSACKLLNCDNHELIGLDSLTFFSCKTTSPLKVTDISDIEVYAAELRRMTEMRTTKGKLIPVYVTCTILKDHEGRKTGMVVVGHDLTEEKALEEKLERIRKERLIAINDAEENERIRIAKDLHDGLGQILTGISYSLQNLTPKNQEETVVLEKIHTNINTAIQEAKNISHNLTPVILRDFGLIAAIENLTAKTNQLNKTKFLFNAYDFHSRIDGPLEKAFYRICQEGIHNVMKHAKAESATIELFREPGQVVLVIEDNGKGFEADKFKSGEEKGGIGLISMRERAYVFDGEFTVNSKPGEGTEILVEIPCRKQQIIDG